MNRSRVSGAALLFSLVALGVAARLLPHPPNFHPVVAVALFGAFLFRSRLAALAVPLLALLASDLCIGFYEPGVMVVVYMSLALPALLRPSLEGRWAPVRLGLTAAACSMLFFLASNLAVWQFSGAYAATAAGLAKCFAAALPFLQYTLGGDLFWTATIFGIYGLLSRLQKIPSDWQPNLPQKRRLAPIPVPVAARGRISR
jgi:hypothetical protein